MEGPDSDSFDAIPAMTLWNDAVKAKRPAEKTRKRQYKKRAKKTKPTTLMETNTTSTESDASDDDTE